MFREGTTGRHRHAIGVALRAPGGTYDSGPPEIVVDPAADARLIVRVDNQSAAAEHLELTVEGMPSGWAAVWPRSVHVPGGEQREADVTVHVPRSAEIKAAEWPLRVVAFARGRRVGSAPARVRIAPHAVVFVELRPEALRARRRAHAEVCVRNEGDASAEVDLTATLMRAQDAAAAARERGASGRATGASSRGDAAPGRAASSSGRVDAASARVLEDDSGPLGCSLSPARVYVAPGEEVVARLEVHAPRRWLKRGDPMSVRVDAQGATAEATFQQRSSIPAWAVVLPVLAAAMFAYLSAGRPSQIAVPEVTGLTVPEAREKLREAGLKPKPAPLQTQPGAQTSGVVRQDPAAGTEIADGDGVTISYYEGAGVGTVTPNIASASVAPSGSSQEPIAYTRANRVLVLFPGESESSVGGTVGELSSDPTWEPRTGELAYVRRASAEADAEVVVVDPHAPGTPRKLTQGEGSYVHPTFSPDGSRLAVVAEAEPGAGGALCVVVPPATAPRCHVDDAFRYTHPVWADGGIYTLRHKPDTFGQDELVRVGTDLVATGRPLATGELTALAVANDGRLAVLNSRRIEIYAPAGELLAAQDAVGDACNLAWSGNDLLVSHGACGSNEEIVQLDPASLSATPTPLFKGGEPAIAG